MNPTPQCIGLIAGGGQFPLLVAQEARSQGLRVAAVGFSGHSNPEMAREADAWEVIKLGHLGRLIDFFKQHGVTRIVMAGTISKPRAMDLKSLGLDWRAAKLLARLTLRGDDQILRAVAEELSSEGLPVVPAHTLLPGLVTPAGVLGRVRPTQAVLKDLGLAWRTAKELGRLDVGQCVVVRRGVVAAVEALEGTDETIRRGCGLAGPRCVAVKVFKPGQTERIDLPSVGLATIELLRDFKALALGVEAGRSLFFDRERALAEADRAGLAVVGLTQDPSVP